MHHWRITYSRGQHWTTYTLPLSLIMQGTVLVCNSFSRRVCFRSLFFPPYQMHTSRCRLTSVCLSISLFISCTKWMISCIAPNKCKHTRTNAFVYPSRHFLSTWAHIYHILHSHASAHTPSLLLILCLTDGTGHCQLAFPWEWPTLSDKREKARKTERDSCVTEWYDDDMSVYKRERAKARERAFVKDRDFSDNTHAS